MHTPVPGVLQSPGAGVKHFKGGNLDCGGMTLLWGAQLAAREGKTNRIKEVVPTARVVPRRPQSGVMPPHSRLRPAGRENIS